MAGHYATDEDVKKWGTNKGDWLVDPMLNNEGGLQAYKDLVERAGGQYAPQIDSQLTRAGELFQDTFKQTVGRAATSDELSNYYKDVLSGDNSTLAKSPNDLRPVLQNYVQSQYAQAAQDNQKSIATDKGKAAAGDITQTFQQTLGRAPTQAELDHFGNMIGSGQADTYTLGQALQTLPEYTQKQDQAARDSLRTEWSSADTQYLTQQVMPALQSQFAQQGRDVSPGSAGLSAALANAAKQTDYSREQYLAGIGHEDYTNQRQQTINNYLNNQSRAYQLQDQSTARNYQLQDSTTNRAYNIQDYMTQQAAYNDYLSRYGNRTASTSGLLSGLQGAMSGAMAGGMAGGPWGALAGAVGGGALGAYGASKQRSIY